MSVCDDYRAKASEYVRLARQSTYISEIKEYLRRAQYLGALAESEEWLAANRDKIVVIQAGAGRQTPHGLAEASDPSPGSVAAQESQRST